MKECTFKSQIAELRPQLEKFFNSIETKYDKERANTVQFYLDNWDTLGDGVIGIIREIICKRHNSRSINKSCDKSADIAVGWANKLGWKTAEVKSNRGLIDYLFHQQKIGALENNYTVYSMCAEKYRNAKQIAQGKEAEMMVIKPIIIRNDLLLKVILECNAYKMTHGCAQLQISVKMYKRLLDYPIPFDVDNVYCPDDFDGVIV